MSVTVNHPIDEVKLAQYIADSWTHLTLWYANTPDGVYANSSATVSPTTLALMSSGTDYEATFTYAGGNAGMWFKVRLYNGSTYSDINDSTPFHGGGGTTFGALRQGLGTMLNDMVIATTTSIGNTTTANISDLKVIRWPDDYFIDFFFHATALGDKSIVTDSAKTGGVITVSPAVTSIASGVAVELTRRFTPEDYRDAINWAIAAAYPKLNRTVTVTSLRTAEDIYQIQVPQDIRVVKKVEIETDSSGLTTPLTATERGHPWREIPYSLIPDGLVQFIEFKNQLPYDPAARRLRVTGEGLLSRVYNDSDMVEIVEPQSTLLLFLAAHHLYTLPPQSSAASDREFYEAQAKYFANMYEGYKNQYASGRAPRKVWGHDQRWNG